MMLCCLTENYANDPPENQIAVSFPACGIGFDQVRAVVVHYLQAKRVWSPIGSMQIGTVGYKGNGKDTNKDRKGKCPSESCAEGCNKFGPMLLMVESRRSSAGCS